MASEVPPSGDSAARYRYLVNAAPAETLRRATTQMLSALDPAAAREARKRLDQSRSLDDSPELAHALLSTEAARAFFAGSSHEQEDAGGDADFGSEFGHEYGYAGGSGFENTDFDKWV